jgi:DNA-binding phage protein
MSDATIVCMGCHSKAEWLVCRFFIRVRDGFLCERCARAAAEQLDRAERHCDAMARVHQAMAHLLALAEPKEPTWLCESAPLRVDVLASQLDVLAHDFAVRRGAFTEDIEVETAAADRPSVVQLAIPAAPPGPSEDVTPEDSRQIRDLLDEPEDGTGDVARVGEKPSAATPHKHGTIGLDSRTWVKRLEAWMRVVGMTPQSLARRVNRDQAFIEHVFTRTDNRTSLRLFLELVRGAGARLCGVPESTPAALIARLQALTRQRRLTLVVLADLTGVHRSQLSTIFNQADPNPCLRTVDRIVTALGATVETVLVPALDRVPHGAAGPSAAQADHVLQ